MARSDGQNRICVAQIGAAHGIRGEVRLRAFARDPEGLMRYGPLVTEDGTRTILIESLRPAKDGFVARLAGVDDRNGAEALRNVELYVTRAQLPPAEEDEFYLADLVGLAAVHVDGTPLGRIVSVPNYGAGDLLEIAPEEGGAPVLVPFTKRAVPQVDLAQGRVTVDPPEGTFDTEQRAAR
jgi:16S rRNA processing protein RimM